MEKILFTLIDKHFIDAKFRKKNSSEILFHSNF